MSTPLPSGRIGQGYRPCQDRSGVLPGQPSPPLQVTAERVFDAQRAVYLLRSRRSTCLFILISQFLKVKSVRQFIYNRNAEHTNFLREYCGELEPDEKPVHLFKIKSDAEETKVNDNEAQNTVAIETEELQTALDDEVNGDTDEKVNASVEVSSPEKKELLQDSAVEMNITKVSLTKKIYMAKNHKETVSKLRCNGTIIIYSFSTLKL